MFLALEVAFATVVFATVAFRLFRLGVIAPLSDELLRAIEVLIKRGDLEAATDLLADAPRRWPTRILQAARTDRSDVDALMLDLFEEASGGLTFVRLSATLSSTLGLLGGILMIRSGFSGQRGLLGLESGLAERVAIEQALLTMAVGVGTAAFAFAGHAALRRGSQRAYEQARRIAKLLYSLEPSECP